MPPPPKRSTLLNGNMKIDSFKSELLVESLGDKWVLRRPFMFYYEEENKTTEIIIPEGFETDFASTPRALYSFFPPIGIYNKASIMHDYLYSKDCHIFRDLPTKKARKVSDNFFLQSMEVLGVPKWQRKLMFYGVRLFGRKLFNT